MKKSSIEIIMKVPMAIGVFCFVFVIVGRYVKPIIEYKLPFKIDIISYIGVGLFALSFVVSLIYLVYSLINYKNKSKK